MKTDFHPIACCHLAVLALTVSPLTSLAQIVINSPPTVIGDQFNLNAGETLNVTAGGQVGNSLRADDGSVVNISGGYVGLYFSAHSGSEVNISGGNVGSIDGALVSSITVFSDSVVTISGGTLGDEFQARSGSEVHISGGTVGREFDAALGSNVELLGGDFQLNGVAYTGDSITLKRFVDREGVFTGTFADGSSFLFSAQAGHFGDNLEGVTLTRVAVPPPDLTPKVINSPATDGPSGLRAGQILTVQTGGKLRNNFAAVDATLNIEGGTLGRNTETAGSVVDISGGSVGDFFYAYSGSEVNISGGAVGFRFEAFDSVVNISDGTVGALFMAHSGSVVDVTGGTVDSVRAESGSEIRITGGTVGAGFTLYNSLIAYSGTSVYISGGTIGSALSTEAGSNVELVGGEYRLNGAEYTGSSITLDSEDTFTGTLADGSSFSFSPVAGDELQGVILTSVTLPPLDLTPRVINTPVVIGPSGLRAGQTLTVQTGGQLPENFAVVNATLNIDGGMVGAGVEVTGGAMNISGGNVGAKLGAINSVVNMSGGTLGERSAARLGSVFNFSGGTVGSKFYAAPGGEVNISGGTVAFDFWARAGSDVELIGGEFRLNGANYTGGSITLGNNDVFTGTLADGSTFVFSRMANPLGDELENVSLTRATLPALDLTPRIVDSPVIGGPSGLRARQKLTVQAGGVLQDHFATVGAVLNIEGGVVGTGLEVEGSTVNILGGKVGDYFQAYGSEVKISGGEVGRFSAHPGTTVNITGGNLASFWSFSPIKQVKVNISDNAVIGYLDAYAGSVVRMTGGTVDGRFGVLNAVATITGGYVRGDLSLNNNSTLNISGGIVGGNLSTTSSTGTEISISGGTVEGLLTISSKVKINLFGRQFLLDGILLDGLQIGNAVTITDRDVNLSGVLADGTVFNFELNSKQLRGQDYFSPDALLTVTLVVPEPASLALVALGSLLLCRRWPKPAGT
jgi:hypothetical protein